MCRSEGSLSQEIRKKIALFASLPVDGDRLRVRRRQHLQGPAHLPRAGGRRLHPRALRRGGAGARPLQLAGADRTRRAGGHGVRCASRLSASTCSSRTPTCLSPRRCATPPRSQDARVEIEWVDSERLEDRRRRGRRARSRGADGILIPGGFGGRGIEGKIAAARIAREQRIPYLGICLGMQVAVAEFARHVAGMEGANSTEFDLETPYPRDRPAARAEGGRGPRRHDAPGGRPDQAARGHPRARDLRRGRRLRAPPPPLRGQQPAAQASAERGSRRMPGPPPTSASSRSIELPAVGIHSSSPPSSTPSSSPAPSARAAVPGVRRRRARPAGHGLGR